MTSERHQGQADKRRAILDGSLLCFARDGYARAALDAIAAEAGVSNRTIYNHFRDKAELFAAVIEESSSRVAAAQIEIIDRHLRKVIDVQADLVEFGLEWVTVPDAGFGPHFALVRQIRAEADHLAPSALTAWWQNGPGRVRQVLADRLAALAVTGVLRIEDADRAAGHLMVLLSADNHPTVGPGSTADTTAMVVAGVHTFLHGYQDGDHP
jgi:AcrR family transcriptional regulator